MGSSVIKFFAYHGETLKLSNNRIERVNSDIDLFLHVFRGLKRFRTAEIWLKGFVIYRNYLKSSKISWHRADRMVVSHRKIEINSIFYVKLSPFKLTIPENGKYKNLVVLIL